MRLFKRKIPKDNVQEIEVLESWTVKWLVKTGRYDEHYVYHKAFINENMAKNYEKQLIESAKFLKCWVKTELYKNEDN